MKVSLITTVKNESLSIPDLYRAILSQTRLPDEWIVVDGGSTDETLSKLLVLSDIQVLVKTGNISTGRNYAIKHCSGGIVAVTDGGSCPHPQWLEKLVTPLEQGLSVITGGKTSAKIEFPLDATQWVIADQFVNPQIPFRQASISSRSLAFLRKVWEEVPYPEWLDIGEDAWLIQEWKRRGHQVAYIEEAIVEWTQRSNLKSIGKQYFYYAWGDGRAGMHQVRHGFRFGFYALILGGMGTGGYWTALGALTWVSYLSANLVRFPQAVAGRSPGFKRAALAWLPMLLLLIDGAKVAGFLRGKLDALWTKTNRGR